MSIFKKKKKQCFFCETKIEKKDAFIVEYKSAEGINKMDVCTSCADLLNKIIDDRNMTFDD